MFRCNYIRLLYMSSKQKEYQKFKANFKQRFEPSFKNIDKNDIDRRFKEYTSLYEKDIDNKNENVKNITITIATMVDLLYLNNQQKGGDDKDECVICYEDNFTPPVKFLCCPHALRDNKCLHGSCNLCWFTLWTDKSFGINEEFKCPVCQKKLQLDDAKFNEIPESFKEFIDNKDALDINSDYFKDVLERVSFRQGDRLTSDLLPELKRLDPAIHEREQNVQEVINNHIQRLEASNMIQKFKNLVLFTSLTLAVHYVSYQNINNINPTLTLPFTPRPGLIEGLLMKYFREPQVYQDPLITTLLVFFVLASFLVEGVLVLNIPTLFHNERLRPEVRQRIELNIRELLENDNLALERQGGKKYRKSRKNRKSRKHKKSRKNRKSRKHGKRKRSYK